MISYVVSSNERLSVVYAELCRVEHAELSADYTGSAL